MECQTEAVESWEQLFTWALPIEEQTPSNCWTIDGLPDMLDQGELDEFSKDHEDLGPRETWFEQNIPNIRYKWRERGPKNSRLIQLAFHDCLRYSNRAIIHHRPFIILLKHSHKTYRISKANCGTFNSSKNQLNLKKKLWSLQFFQKTFFHGVFKSLVFLGMKMAQEDVMAVSIGKELDMPFQEEMIFLQKAKILI